MKHLAVISLALAAWSSHAYAESNSIEAVKHARALCKFFDSNGFSSKPCEVQGGKQINAWLDMTAGEAQTMCRQIGAMTKEAQYAFDGDWTLNIYSPYSGASSIAFCKI